MRLKRIALAGVPPFEADRLKASCGEALNTCAFSLSAIR
jgi:hypothetical protein